MKKARGIEALTTSITCVLISDVKKITMINLTVVNSLTII